MYKSNNAVKVYRGDFLESTHELHIAVVNNNGELLYSHGNPMRQTFPRSSLKPFQAIPLIQRDVVTTYNFTDADIAICCASHNGESKHRDQVMSILNKLNLDESYLKCGAHPPKNEAMYKKLIHNNESITQIFNNCSGKHAGMLGDCLVYNEDVNSYYKSSHPLQEEIKDILVNVCNVNRKDLETSIDGCGLPTHRFPLHKLAQGFSHLVSPKTMHDQTYSNSLRRIRNSMISHPDMVGGESSFDTDIMKNLSGKIVAKAGAEGVQGIGLVDSGIGIAIKVEDGNPRGAGAATIEVLKQLNLISHSDYKLMTKYHNPQVMNVAGLTVGEIITDFQLKQ